MANHTFTPMPENEHKCEVCQYGENLHGTCECCPNTDHLVKFMTMMMCEECYTKNKSMHEISQSPEAIASRLERMNATMDANRVIERAKIIDSSLAIRTDLFNAKTVAIAKLREAIDNDDAITNKAYTMAEVMVERFLKLKDIVIEKQQEIVNDNTEMRAIQTYLNNTANQLRSEERERLRLTELNYNPTPVRLPSTTRIKSKVAGTKAKPKFNKSEVKNAAADLSRELRKPIPEYMLQQILIAHNFATVAEGTAFLKAQLSKVMSVANETK